MKVLTIALYDLIKFSRERTALMIMILVPIIFTFVMGTALGNMGSATDSDNIVKIPVGISNLDQGPIGQELINILYEDKTIIVEELAETELFEKVKNSSVEQGYVIPENFSKLIQTGAQPVVKTLSLPKSAENMITQSILSTAFTKLRVKAATESYFQEVLTNLKIENEAVILADINAKVVENLQKPDLVAVAMTKNGSQVVNTGLDSKTQISIGILVMFVMFTVIFSAGELLEEKKIYTWERLSTTPTLNSQIMMGKLLGTFFKGWIQISILIVFGTVFMGVSWGKSLNLSLLVLSIFLLTVTSLGFLLSTMVKTNSQLGAFSSILIVCSSMLSGCYWPVELEPELMQKIAAFFPQYWAIKALTNTVGSGMGIKSIIVPILILVIMSIVFFTLSLIVQFTRTKQPHLHQ